MALTKVTSGVRTLGTGEVATANMATDPTNASNLSSGSVPLAQLGNVDTSGITANQDDIALLGFKVAANGSLARYNLVDQSIDAFEDASGVDASASTNESRDASNYYSGSSSGEATGGTVTTYGSYKVHSFTSTGDTDFIVPASGDVDYLVVAGGGAAPDGGTSAGGGGGGMRTGTGLSLTAQTYTVTVGAGGVAASVTVGASGGDSIFSTITAAGGGGGSSGSSATDGADGGTGGGGSGYTSGGGDGGSGNTPITSPSQGGDGGDGSDSAYSSGGGGGGGASPSTPGAGIGINGGWGGDGTANDYRTGVSVTYAGGGGGGGDCGGPSRSCGGAAGAGGGGVGGSGHSPGQAGTAGTDGLGGGGGGAREGDGGNGGSGIVVIRYPASGNFDSYENMTLVSNAQTAESVPTNGDLVMTISNGAGTTTPNTDIKAYITRDGSDYTTAVTLVDQGDTGGHTILTANGVDLSGETSGTAMRWKITTHNQSVSKTTRIQAVSLGWS